MAAQLHVLFLSTGNACRSQMAEAWARSLKSDVITAYSAGVDVQKIYPQTLNAMAEVDLDLQEHSVQHITDFKQTQIDVVITLCDHAHETCPWFPENAKVVHVGFEDPRHLANTVAEAGGSEEEQFEFYRIVRDDIRRFVEGLPDNLPEA
ncbi:arsenate reductase ArsC [Kiritimatiellota bacterium B12222]|nr:arsenate reductase ArsC [Kiritimatiellota bacterium B12222]